MEPLRYVLYTSKKGNKLLLRKRRKKVHGFNADTNKEKWIYSKKTTLGKRSKKVSGNTKTKEENGQKDTKKRKEKSSWKH